MDLLVPLLLLMAGFAVVLGGVAWLGSRARRRGIGGGLMGPLDEVYHPSAHRYRIEIEQHAQRLTPMPSADDRVRPGTVGNPQARPSAMDAHAPTAPD